MSTNVVDVAAKIILILEGITQLNAIYEYDPGSAPEGKFPFATVTFEGTTAEFGDTIRNKRIYTFAIKVYQERLNAAFGNQKADRIIREIADSIITAFDNNTTLDGLVQMVEPISAETDYIEREVGDIRVINFTVNALKVVDSIT